MRNNDYTKLFLDKLVFHIFTIGYKNQGESIVFMVESDFGIVYSGMIDSYEVDGVNISHKILEKYDIKSLDFICWTHPHIDHSLGFENILNIYANEKTKIVYPLHLMSINVEEIAQDTVKAIDNIKDTIKSRKIKKAKVMPVLNNLRIERIDFGNGLPDSHSNFSFEIWSLAPISDIVEKRDLTRNVVNVNDYSVVLNVLFNDKVFLFAGDIQDSSIKKVQPFSIPKKVDFIKIPHHSSSGSLEMIKWLKNFKADIACTTEFKTCNLPNQCAIEYYKECCECFYSTHTGEGDYGVLYTKYDVLKDEFHNDVDGRMKEL